MNCVSSDPSNTLLIQLVIPSIPDNHVHTSTCLSALTDIYHWVTWMCAKNTPKIINYLHILTVGIMHDLTSLATINIYKHL